MQSETDNTPRGINDIQSLINDRFSIFAFLHILDIYSNTACTRKHIDMYIDSIYLQILLCDLIITFYRNHNCNHF